MRVTGRWLSSGSGIIARRLWISGDAGIVLGSLGSPGPVHTKKHRGSCPPNVGGGEAGRGGTVGGPGALLGGLLQNPRRVLNLRSVLRHRFKNRQSKREK